MVGLGLISIIVGLVVFFVLAAATRKAILDEIVIDSPNHENYADWLSGSDPDDEAIYVDYYLFNLTNPGEFQRNNAKPIVAEVGPFRYRRYDTKVDVAFLEGGNKVQYKTRYTYQFVPSLNARGEPNPSPATIITSVNPFYLAGVQTAGSEDNLNLVFLSGAFRGFAQAPTTWGTDPAPCALAPLCGFAYHYRALGLTLNTAQSTAITRAFDNNPVAIGYYMGLIVAYTSSAGNPAAAAQVAQLIDSNYGAFSVDYRGSGSSTSMAMYLVGYLQSMAPLARVPLNRQVGSQFGLLFRQLPAQAHLFGPDPFLLAAQGISAGYSTNHTGNQASANATVWTGKSSSNLAGMNHYTELDGITQITAYQTTLPVNGRTQSMPPFQGATPDKITLYFETLRRYVDATFNGVQDVEGIETARYVANTAALGVVNPAYNVTVRGLAPMAYFTGGAPLYLSEPHMGGADPAARDSTSGQNHLPDAHRTFLDIEPITGYPLEAALRTQVNILVNVSSMSLSDLPNANSSTVIFFPAMWGNRNFRISSDGARSLRRAVVTAVMARRAILGSLVGMGVVCVLIGAALMVQKGGNETSSSNDAASSNAKAESAQPESEQPNADDGDLQPFVPPPHPNDMDQEMDNVGPQQQS